MVSKDALIFAGVSVATVTAILGCQQYNVVKERQLKEKKLENDRLYFEKLTPDQVEKLEKEKLDVERQRIELKTKEVELKKTVVDFKNDIQKEIEKSTMTAIHDDMRTTFDEWSAKYENRLDAKVDRVVERIDNLSDKYGGVKASPAAVPAINVVNAPNN